MSSTSTTEIAVHPLTTEIEKVIANGGTEFLAVDVQEGRYPVTIGAPDKPLDIDNYTSYPARVAAEQDHPSLGGVRPPFAGRLAVTPGGTLRAYWVGDADALAWESAELRSVTTTETQLG